MPHDPAQLAALEAVLRLGAFDAAAAELNVTPSAISQRIRALEDRVGTPLVLRGPPARATPTGARLAQHARELALLDAALAQDLEKTARPARVRIALNADSVDTWAVAALAQTPFLFDVQIMDESVSADLVRNGDASGALSTQKRPVQGCDVHALGAMRYIATCSPSFFSRHFADGVTVDALSTAPMLDFSGVDQLQRSWLTRTAGQALTPPTHYLPSTHGFVDGACHGLGWALNPLPLVADDLASGRLVPLLPDAPQDVPLYWHVRHLVAPALAPLTKALRRAARAALVPIPPA